MLQGNSSRRVSRYSRITHAGGEVIQVRVHQGNLPERRIIHLAINGREEYTDGYLLRNSGRAASSLPHLTGWFVSLGSRFHGCGKRLRAEPPGTTAGALTPPPKTIFPETRAAVRLNAIKAQTERNGPVLSFIPFLREGFFSPRLVLRSSLPRVPRAVVVQPREAGRRRLKHAAGTGSFNGSSHASSSTDAKSEARALGSATGPGTRGKKKPTQNCPFSSAPI